MLPVRDPDVSDLVVGLGDGHDSSGGKLPLSPGLRCHPTTEDGLDGPVGVLVAVVRVFVFAVVFLFFFYD